MPRANPGKVGGKGRCQIVLLADSRLIDRICLRANMDDKAQGRGATEFYKLDLLRRSRRMKRYDEQAPDDGTKGHDLAPAKG
ncbi:MAG: hypothetical protein ABS87_13195 [Sphingomonas sp. SCN 67-18]|nr:MAG: hypothetical protein ABS87_13195 [Sphingomonas sp. SCN 67-18]